MLFQPIKPMLLTMERNSFDDEKYLFEIKWDGGRILLHKQGDRIEAYTRRGNRVTEKFPELREALGSINAHSAVIDCEGVCIRGGRSVFDDFAYRERLTNPVKIKTAAHTKPATFVAFDLLYTDKDHTGESLLFRKKRLHDLIQPSEVLLPSPYVDGEGINLHKLTKDRGLEGIVAKRKNSTYQFNTRSPDWAKIKNLKLIDTVILGYRENPFELVVGLNFQTVKNKPVATVQFGMSPEEKLAFRGIAKDLQTKHDGNTQWIKPIVCCRIQYLDRTEQHHLRITGFKGFLFDKHPEECVWYS